MIAAHQVCDDQLTQSGGVEPSVGVLNWAIRTGQGQVGGSEDQGITPAMLTFSGM